MHSSHSIEDGDPNASLPERLFAVDKYPSKARLTIYSKPEYLGRIAKLLEGTPEWDKITKSQFGNLFKLPVTRCSHSGKLIHGFLCRQLVTQKKNELWFVFGGQPIQFSLREFCIVTGLRCSQFPSAEEVEKHRGPSVWKRLFKKKIVTVAEVWKMIDEDKKLEKSKQMSSWKKLCLVLIVIVDCSEVAHFHFFGS